MADKLTGKVKWFGAEKGWGFITAADGTDYFVGGSDVLNNQQLAKGDAVSFSLKENPKGLKAVSVTKLEETTNDEPNF